MAKKRVAGKAKVDQPVSFERPPVDEVYISLQTKEPVFPSDDFGELVNIFGTQFPKLNAQAKLDRNVEREEVGPLGVQVELVTNLGQRFWLISQDETRVLQIQDDRIVYNWRKRDGTKYPRFNKIRKEFEDALGKIVKAKGLKTDDLIDLCEVSYTNILEMPDGSDPRGQLHRFFKHVHQIDVVPDRLAVEETAFSAALRILDDAGNFMGRMRIQTQPAIRRTDKKLIVQSRLSYRGTPSSPSVKSALQFCNDGHLAIVNTFRSMTTKEMHNFWGLE